MDALYHDFSVMGVANPQLPGHFVANQRVKAPVIQGFIDTALATLAREGSPATFLELFCADGYYAMYARWRGAVRAAGLDSDRDGYFASATAMRDRLGLTDVEFHQHDVRELPQVGTFSIVANVGGLYHVEDPGSVLDWSYAICERYLIVQTVVSLANSDPSYFESPAPGLPWGSRHSRESFDRMLRARNWSVIDSTFAVLEANERACDRGSLFYLIEKPRRP